MAPDDDRSDPEVVIAGDLPDASDDPVAALLLEHLGRELPGKLTELGIDVGVEINVRKLPLRGG